MRKPLISSNIPATYIISQYIKLLSSILTLLDGGKKEGSCFSQEVETKGKI